jgi:eukaryotic translation initiation factor 2C
MGVSYASPAYYADRLCERGRHYLRDFYTLTDAGKHYRDTQRQKKAEAESKAKEKRIATCGIGKQGGQKRTMSKEEIAHRDQDRKDAEDVAKKYAMKEVEDKFYPYGQDVNPWHDNIKKTMFWM